MSWINVADTDAQSLRTVVAVMNDLYRGTGASIDKEYLDHILDRRGQIHLQARARRGSYTCVILKMNPKTGVVKLLHVGFTADVPPEVALKENVRHTRALMDANNWRTMTGYANSTGSSGSERLDQYLAALDLLTWEITSRDDANTQVRYEFDRDASMTDKDEDWTRDRTAPRPR